MRMAVGAPAVGRRCLLMCRQNWQWLLFNLEGSTVTAPSAVRPSDVYLWVNIAELLPFFLAGLCLCFFFFAAACLMFYFTSAVCCVEFWGVFFCMGK